MNTDINKMTDLELAKIQGNLYQQFMQIQGNLIAISQEIEKRGLKMETKPEINKKK
jgi:hypothetical protein